MTADHPAPARDTPVLSWRKAQALALATGLLYFFAFPGIELWPLSFVTWVPLLVAMHGRGTRCCAGLAWISGITMTFVGFYWMLDMLQSFSGFSVPLCILFMALLAAYQGGRIALFGALAARPVTLGWWRGPSYALAFVVSELCYPLLFPWYFGATLHQLPVALQLAELGGPILVGLVSFFVNYALAGLVIARLQGHPLRFRLLAAAVGVLLSTLGYGALRMAQVDELMAAAAKGRVGIVQANMGLIAKRSDRAEGLRRHVELSKSLEQRAPHDLIVWSETSVAGAVYEHEADAFYRRLFTSDFETPLLFGALLMRDVEDARGVTLFNTALMTDRQGKLVGRYDKQALLAFGEYLPLGDTFPILYEWSPNTGKFTAGSTLDALPLGERKISAHICYEDVLPGFVNDLVRRGGADLLVNLTNDAWYGDTTQPWIHLALAKFRAIEHRRFLVRATNSGVSAFVDANGRVVSHTNTFESATLSEEIRYLSVSTPFEWWGHAPYWLCAGFVLVTCAVGRQRLLAALARQR